MTLTAQLTLSNVSVSLKASGHPDLFLGSWINDWRRFLSNWKSIFVEVEGAVRSKLVHVKNNHQGFVKLSDFLVINQLNAQILVL